MGFVDVIAKKRDGQALSRDEIFRFTSGVTSDQLPDYQASALLMAIVLRGMSHQETAWLTEAMVASGSRVDLSDISTSTVGKHSTGGVGDKVSIALVPLAAACGVVVPKMSGRGLGHTGGTLDKLESIPGYRIDFTVDEFKSVLRRVGASIIGQTASLAPADKKIYALRDVTGTVESIPLLASSIMSKKLAEGSSALLLDVKSGDGAFMKNAAGARELAEAMVAIGTHAGVRTEAMITDMEAPLGKAVGNSLEIRECIDVLRGAGPADVIEVVNVFASRMIVLAGVERDEAAAATRVTAAIKSGRALQTFERMIEAHGGNPRVAHNPGLLPVAPSREPFPARRPGYVTKLAAEAIGRAANALGAGRSRVGDAVDHGVGITMLAAVGDKVEEGQPLLELHHRNSRGLTAAVSLCRTAVTIGDAPLPPRPKLLGEVRPPQ